MASVLVRSRTVELMQASFSVHAGGCNAHSTNGDYFFETWDTQMLNVSYKLTQCCDENSTKCLNNLVSHTLLARHLWVAAGKMSERRACEQEDNCGAIPALVRAKAELQSTTELVINECAAMLSLLSEGLQESWSSCWLDC